jgi:RNA-directed DNA polymerase
LAWIAKRYRKYVKGRIDFCATHINAKGEPKAVRLFQAADLPIRYHIKIRSEANPYDKAYSEYFEERKKKRRQMAMLGRIF